MTEIRPDAVPQPYPMPRVGSRDALAAFDRGDPVVVERGHLADGRPALRVRLVDAPRAVGGVRAVHIPRRRVHPAVWVAGIGATVGFLAALGWALAGLAALVLGHAVEIGGALALAVLVLAALGGGTCVTVITIRHHH